MTPTIYKGKITKSLLEKAAKFGQPLYSVTKRFVKGWQYNGEYIPNPVFTPDNVLKARLMVFEVINKHLKAGFELNGKASYTTPNTGMLVLNRGSQSQQFLLGLDEYQEITAHIAKQQYSLVK